MQTFVLLVPVAFTVTTHWNVSELKGIETARSVTLVIVALETLQTLPSASLTRFTAASAERQLSLSGTAVLSVGSIIFYFFSLDQPRTAVPV
jgi:hypothetical protein